MVVRTLIHREGQAFAQLSKLVGSAVGVWTQRRLTDSMAGAHNHSRKVLGDQPKVYVIHIKQCAL